MANSQIAQVDHEILWTKDDYSFIGFDDIQFFDVPEGCGVCRLIVTSACISGIDVSHPSSFRRKFRFQGLSSEGLVYANQRKTVYFEMLLDSEKNEIHIFRRVKIGDHLCATRISSRSSRQALSVIHALAYDIQNSKIEQHEGVFIPR